MLNPVWLQTLRAVVETGSFAGAARRLGYTPSAISQQMAGLERQVNAVLFERERPGIKPTATALRLVERAAPLLARLAELDNDLLDRGRPPSEPLRLGSFADGVRYVAPALHRLAVADPPVAVSLTVGDSRKLVAAVTGGALNVAVVERYDVVPRTWPAEVTVRPIAEESMVLLLPAAHPFAGRTRIAMHELRDETWLAGSADGDDGACLLQLCAAAGFRPAIRLYTQDLTVLPELVRAQVGIALVPATCGPTRGPTDGSIDTPVGAVSAAGRADMSAGYRPPGPAVLTGLVQVPPAGTAPRRRVELVHRVADVGPDVAAFTTALRGRTPNPA